METVETRTETIHVDPEGIVRCVVKEVASMTEEDARANIAAIWECNGQRPARVLVDARKTHHVTREARAFLAGEETARVQAACALWVSSPVSTLIANFFMGFNRPRYPVRIFSSEADALKWLRDCG